MPQAEGSQNPKTNAASFRAAMLSPLGAAASGKLSRRLVHAFGAKTGYHSLADHGMIAANERAARTRCAAGGGAMSKKTVARPSIGIVGDYDHTKATHRLTSTAFDYLSNVLSYAWVPTVSLEVDTAKRLGAFDGLLIAPGSPYRSMAGAISAIAFARECGVPLLGT